MFYELTQNNSGGSFEVNEKLAHLLFIEADSVEEACLFAESLGCYWDGVDEGWDCDCCGDRWHRPWDNDGVTYPYEWSDGIVFNSVEEHAQYLANNYGMTVPDSRIFYKDGTVKEIFSQPENASCLPTREDF